MPLSPNHIFLTIVAPTARTYGQDAGNWAEYSQALLPLCENILSENYIEKSWRILCDIIFLVNEHQSTPTDGHSRCKHERSTFLIYQVLWISKCIRYEHVLSHFMESKAS